MTFDSIPLSDTRNIRPLIGYLPQEFSLYPDMSVLEIMRYLAALSNLPITDEEVAQKLKLSRSTVQRRRTSALGKQREIWGYDG